MNAEIGNWTHVGNCTKCGAPIFAREATESDPEDEKFLIVLRWTCPHRNDPQELRK